MRRIHAIELEDLAWLPKSLRDGVTDYLQMTLLLANPYRGIAPLLSEAMAQSRTEQIIDLGAGGGGPWRRLLPLLDSAQTHPKVLLTDKFPNQNAFAAISQHFPKQIKGYAHSVDASAVPSELKGFRTMFSSFHHFQPDQAHAIIANAVEHAQGIGIFEATRRDIPTILSMILTPIMALILAPFTKPWRWSRLLWTYLLPFLPLIVAFDGVVSCLRTYTPDELRAFVGSIPGSENYTWQIGLSAAEKGSIPVTYLIGYPNTSA